MKKLLLMLVVVVGMVGCINMIDADLHDIEYKIEGIGQQYQVYYKMPFNNWCINNRSSNFSIIINDTMSWRPEMYVQNLDSGMLVASIIVDGEVYITKTLTDKEESATLYLY